MRRCEFCDSPVPADATVCPICREEIQEETLERILPLLKRPEAVEVRSMGITERLWGVIRRPSATYRDIAQKPDMAGPFVVILINALLMSGIFIAMASKVSTLVVLNATTGETAEVSILATSAGISFFTAALVSVLPNMMIGMLYLLLGSAFAHLAFKVTGGLGRKGKTASVVGYSMVPVLLFRLIALVVVLVSMSNFPYIIDAGSSNAGVVFDVVDWAYNTPVWLAVDYLMVAAFIWTGFLLIFGIREAHDTSTLWAFFVAVACTAVLIWTFWQVH